MSLLIDKCWEQYTLQMNISVGVTVKHTAQAKAVNRGLTDLDRPYRLQIVGSI